MQKAATKPIHAPRRDITNGHSYQPQQPQWERARVVCAHLKISDSTLWHWAKTREDFPQPVKAGPRVTLFDLTAINAWLQQGVA